MNLSVRFQKAQKERASNTWPIIYNDLGKYIYSYEWSNIKQS